MKTLLPDRTDRGATHLKLAGCDKEGVSPDHIRDLGDGTYVMIRRLLFHWMLIRGDFENLVGYWDRWCYADEANARSALEAFPENPSPGYEPTGWHRHPPSGRRRPDGDPEREHLEN